MTQRCGAVYGIEIQLCSRAQMAYNLYLCNCELYDLQVYVSVNLCFLIDSSADCNQIIKTHTGKLTNEMSEKEALRICTIGPYEKFSISSFMWHLVHMLPRL